MADPTFGISIIPVDAGPRPAVAGDFSVVGLVVTAPDADALTYPLNTPVLINSADATAVDALGDTGSIAGQIDLINAQLDALAGSASIVIVRADVGVDDDATIANLVAAIPALEDAPAALGVEPRLIAVPGFTHQQADPQTANPVVAALPGTLGKLFARAYVTGPHLTLQAFTDWRETISDKRITPIETWAKAGSPAADIDSVGAVIGVRLQTLAETGGVPSKSIANRSLAGIVSANRAIPFSIIDGDTEGQQILALNGGIIVRGEAGMATSIGTGGFTLISTDTASNDPLWRFSNVVDMRDYIHVLFLKTLRGYLGKFNLTSQTIESVIQTMTIALRDLQADGHLLGFEVGFNPDQNSPESLRQGTFRVSFAAEEPPVFGHLEIESARYRVALDDLLADLIAA